MYFLAIRSLGCGSALIFESRDLIFGKGFACSTGMISAVPGRYRSLPKADQSRNLFI